jgi:transposase
MTEPVPAQRLRQRSSFFARSVAASIRHLAGLPGLMQADAFAGIQSPLRGRPQAGAHNRGCLLGHHGAFGLARISKAPIAAGAGIDALFAIEREIIGLAPAQRVAVLSVRSRPLIVELDSWLREQRAKVSKNSDTDYSLKHWTELTRFRLCMTNNAADRERRAVVVGYKNWTFAGSDKGGRRAAATLFATTRFTNVDHDLLPWNTHAERRATA